MLKRGEFLYFQWPHNTIIISTFRCYERSWCTPNPLKGANPRQENVIDIKEKHWPLTILKGCSPLKRRSGCTVIKEKKTWTTQINWDVGTTYIVKDVDACRLSSGFSIGFHMFFRWILWELKHSHLITPKQQWQLRYNRPPLFFFGTVVYTSNSTTIPRIGDITLLRIVMK